MAKQNSLIKIKGTLDDLTFYKTRDGYLVRTKGGITKERILNDPAFARTRENGKEFGHLAKSGKLIRTALRQMLQKAKDSRVTTRLTQTLAKVKNEDIVSLRGDRNVGIGLDTDAGKAILKDFDFNNQATLHSMFFASFTVDTSTGAIAMDNFNPSNDMLYPTEATHVQLSSGFARLDFTNYQFEMSSSTVVNLAINSTSQSVNLTPSNVPSLAGHGLHVLLLEFFQEVNGTSYALKSGAYNVLHIVAVS